MQQPKKRKRVSFKKKINQATVTPFWQGLTFVSLTSIHKFAAEQDLLEFIATNNFKLIAKRKAQSNIGNELLVGQYGVGGLTKEYIEEWKNKQRIQFGRDHEGSWKQHCLNIPPTCTVWTVPTFTETGQIERFTLEPSQSNEAALQRQQESLEEEIANNEAIASGSVVLGAKEVQKEEQKELMEEQIELLRKNVSFDIYKNPYEDDMWLNDGVTSGSILEDVPEPVENKKHNNLGPYKWFVNALVAKKELIEKIVGKENVNDELIPKIEWLLKQVTGLQLYWQYLYEQSSAAFQTTYTLESGKKSPRMSNWYCGIRHYAAYVILILPKNTLYPVTIYDFFHPDYVNAYIIAITDKKEFHYIHPQTIRRKYEALQTWFAWWKKTADPREVGYGDILKSSNLINIAHNNQEAARAAWTARTHTPAYLNDLGIYQDMQGLQSRFKNVLNALLVWVLLWDDHSKEEQEWAIENNGLQFQALLMMNLSLTLFFPRREIFAAATINRFKLQTLQMTQGMKIFYTYSLLGQQEKVTRKYDASIFPICDELMLVVWFYLNRIWPHLKKKEESKDNLALFWTPKGHPIIGQNDANHDCLTNWYKRVTLEFSGVQLTPQDDRRLGNGHMMNNMGLTPFEIQVLHANANHTEIVARRYYRFTGLTQTTLNTSVGIVRKFLNTDFKNAKTTKEQWEVAGWSKNQIELVMKILTSTPYIIETMNTYDNVIMSHRDATVLSNISLTFKKSITTNDENEQQTPIIKRIRSNNIGTSKDHAKNMNKVIDFIIDSDDDTEEEEEPPMKKPRIIWEVDSSSDS